MRTVILLLGLASIGCASMAGNRPQGPCEQQVDGGWRKFQRGLGGFSGVGQSVASSHRAEYYACKRDAAATAEERQEWEVALDRERGTYASVSAEERRAKEAAETAEHNRRMADAAEDQAAAAKRQAAADEDQARALQDLKNKTYTCRRGIGDIGAVRCE